MKGKHRALLGAAVTLTLTGVRATAQVVDVELRVVTGPVVYEAHELPVAASEVCLGGDFYVDVWVTCVQADSPGIAGGTVDIAYPAEAVAGRSIDHTGILGELVTGTIQHQLGAIDNVGGSTLETTAATSPPWALLARVSFRACEAGTASFSLAPGAFRFALAGGQPPLEFGTDVQLGPPQAVDVIVPGGIVSSEPPDGAIDARQPHALNDDTTRYGWDSVDVTFDRCAVAAAPTDFVITEVGGTRSDPPVIVDVIAVDERTARLVLDKPIRPGAWTVFTHEATGTAICLGYLPADANQDRRSTPVDILGLIDSLNRVPGHILPEYAADIDRSRLVGPPDILRLIDLLNGAAMFTPWLNVSIGPSPCEGR